MGFKFLKFDTLPLTHATAKTFAEMPHWAGERKVSEKRLRYLSKEIASGTFYSPRWATCYCKSEGKLYRVNGQHSSIALRDCNGSFPSNLTVIVDRFECDDTSDLLAVFSKFDSKANVRTPGEMLRIHANQYEHLLAVDDSTIRCAIDGIAKFIYFIGGDSASKKYGTSVPIGLDPDHARCDTIHAYHSFIAWAAPLLTPSHTAQHIRRKVVVAAIYATFIRDSVAAAEFWRCVRSEDGPIGKPIRQLAAFIKELPSKLPTPGMKGFRPEDMRFTERGVFAVCIHGWNAYRRNAPTRLAYYADAPIPDPV